REVATRPFGHRTTAEGTRRAEVLEHPVQVLHHPPHQRERAGAEGAERWHLRPPLQRARSAPGPAPLLLRSLVRTGLLTAGVGPLRRARRLRALRIRLYHRGPPRRARAATACDATRARDGEGNCLPARELISATAYAATGTSGGRRSRRL